MSPPAAVGSRSSPVNPVNPVNPVGLLPPPPAYGEHLSHMLRTRSPCPSPALLSSHTLSPIPSRTNSDSSTSESTASVSSSAASSVPSPLSSSEDPSPVSSAPNSAIFPSSTPLPRSGASTPTSSFLHHSPNSTTNLNHQTIVSSASSAPLHSHPSHSRSHTHTHSPHTHHHATPGMNRGGAPQRLARLTSVASMLSVTSGVSMASAHRTLDPILLQHYLGLSRTLADLAPCPELLARNQAHVAQLEQEVASQKALLPKLKRRSHKEHKDVERLRKLTLSSLAAMLRGKYSSSLAREEQEFWASYAALQAAEDRVAALNTALQVAHATQTSLQAKCTELEAADREMAELESLLFPDLIAPPVPSRQQQHERGRTLTRGARSRVASGATTPRLSSSAVMVDSGAPSLIGTPRCRSLSPSIHSIVSSDQQPADNSNAPPSCPRSISPHQYHQSAASLLLDPPTTPAAVRAQVAVALAQRDSTLEFIRVQQRRLEADRASLTTSHDHLNAALRHVNHAIAVMDQIRPDPCMECARLARMVEEAGGAQTGGSTAPRARSSGPSASSTLNSQHQVRRGRSAGPSNAGVTGATSGVSDSDGGYTSGRGAGYDTDGPFRAPRMAMFRWGASSSSASTSQPQQPMGAPGRRQRTFSMSSSTSTSSSSSDSSFERSPHHSAAGQRDNSQSRSRSRSRSMSRGRLSLSILRPRPSGVDLATRGNTSDADSVRDQLERRGRMIRVVEDPVSPGPASATFPASTIARHYDEEDNRPMPVAPLPLTYTLSAPVSLVTTRNTHNADHDDTNTSRSRSRGGRSRRGLRWGGRRTDADEDEPDSSTFPSRSHPWSRQQSLPQPQPQRRISVADLVGRCSLHPKVIPGAPTRRYSFSLGGTMAKVASGAGAKGMGGADIGLPKPVVTKVYDDTQIARLHVHEAVQAVPDLADVVPMPSLQVSITATSVANIRSRLKTATSRLTRLIQETVRRQVELDNDAAFLRNDAVRAKRQAADTLVSLLRSAAMGGEATAAPAASNGFSAPLSLAAASTSTARAPSSTLQRLARSTLAAAGMGLTQTMDRLPAYEEAVAGGASGTAAQERPRIEV